MLLGVLRLYRRPAAVVPAVALTSTTISHRLPPSLPPIAVHRGARLPLLPRYESRVATL